MRFNTYYCAWSIILFLIELYIALHIDDNFIRPYIGDLLVVILIYAIVRAFFKVSIMTAAIGVLIFSFAVEVLQSFKIVEILGLGASQLARTIIGTTFSWEDLVAYSIGIIILLCFEKAIGPYKREWYSIQ
ncbi:DUF2809 domain-containing protein [Acaryochloris marina]|uniref:ribosomal maturation YjgA family protein n=1 Tax=Acaryochloris marina TaxID=155978 RepID=UPI001BB0074E|nr:DUF2809 domain-containing protein [Acaryochloris marina]QUY41466.1 DUF2809 domain-containing protein [Acaryochloris marina S15]